MTFGEVGVFGRYEAWFLSLAAFSVLTVLPVLVKARPTEPVAALPQEATTVNRRALVLAAALMTVAVGPRSVLLVQTPTAIANVHHNQQQIAQFLATYYDGDTVVVNDLGWVSWRHRGPVLDVTGLGTRDLLLDRRRGQLTAARLGNRATEAEAPVMVVYVDPFEVLVPPGWTTRGYWCLEGRLYVLNDRCVLFASPAGLPSERLDRALKGADATLPPRCDTAPRCRAAGSAAIH